MTSKKRICYTCGKEYRYCPHCGGDANKPTWMVCFDCESCKDIFNALSNYNSGYYKAEDVLNVLKKHDIKDLKGFREKISKDLETIVDSTSIKKTTKKNTYKVSDVSTEPTDETIVDAN